jgi:hypothetical protein
MVRIGTGTRPAAGQAGGVRAPADVAEVSGTTGSASRDGVPRDRALLVLDGESAQARDSTRRTERSAAGRPRAGFIAQLLATGDPTLLPSRLERTRRAAALYDAAAQRLA